MAAGLGVDRLVGEPRRVPHPVALFGQAMGELERAWYAPRLDNGVAYTAAGAGIGALAGLAVRSTALATYVAVAGRSLANAATEVGVALDAGDLELARTRLPALVGRDPSKLDEAELCRAVVESVAENTVDAVVAPALWAGLGGAAGALGYRAVNTMDAMVGHRSERYRRFGTPAARLDDAANWLPARVTALLVAAVRPGQATEVWRTVRADAPAHPSPNAGVAEAAFAAGLGVRLGGRSQYGERIEDRPRLGRGRPVRRDDIGEAVRLSRDCTALLGVTLVGAGLVVDRGAHGRGRRRP
ncbi:MAG: adenosylcobinamide-phosphate synthase CbiB [Actinomycetota bacterium]